MFTRSKQHLTDNNETYFQHMIGAFRYGLLCLKAALMAFAHGICPGAFQTTASETIACLSTHKRKDS